jgi:hypothetical protein
VLSVPSPAARATADRVAAASQRWLADHAPQLAACQEPAALARRVATHSLATALALPALPVPDLTTLACLRLWAHALTREPAGAELWTGTLAALRRRLSRRPRFAVFRERWQAGMQDAVRAGAAIRGWQAAERPGFDEYLDTAATALAMRPFTLAAAALSGGPDWTEVARLDPLVQAAARCLALSADRAPAAALLVQRALLAQGVDERQALNRARAHLRAKWAVDLALLRTQAQVAPVARAALAHGLYAYTAFLCQTAEPSEDRAGTLVAA